MSKRVRAAEAKARFSALIAEAGQRGERFVIERRGKPIAAIVGHTELGRLEKISSEGIRPLGALALAGAWREVGDVELEDLIKHIYAARDMDTGYCLHSFASSRTCLASTWR